MRVLVILAICTAWLVVAQPSSSIKGDVVHIPFVGCPSDGQQGPIAASTRDSKAMRVSPKIAKQVAFYQAEHGIGVLAPRGWHCAGTYGSNGENLYVSPEPIDPATLLSSEWDGFRGPAIQISHAIGDTSGRFEVARIIARAFPAHRAFVRRVMDEGLEPASDFPLGSYPQDKLTYRSKEMVEFETPAQTEGLGTHSRLRKNSSPISGVAILKGDSPDLLFLSVRLPAKLRGLGPIIVSAVENDSVRDLTFRGSAARPPSPAPGNR